MASRIGLTHRVSRHPVLLLVLLSIVVAARPAAARQDDAEAKLPSEYKIVEFDVAANAFRLTPPFDVPFIIEGVAGEGTTRVDVSYKCKQPHGKLMKINSGGPYTWVPRQPASADGRFKVFVVHPLEAKDNCNFTFVFRSRLGEKELVTFRLKAAEEISGKLLGMFPLPNKDVNQRDSEDLRAALGTMLAGLAAPGRVVLDRSVFDRTVPAPQFNAFLRDALEAQDNTTLRRSTVTTNRGALQPLLSGIHGNALLAQLREALDDSQEKEAGELMQANPKAFALLDQDDAAARALGLAPNPGPKTTIALITDVGDVDLLLRNYADTGDSLIQLINVLAGVGKTPGMVPSMSANQVKQVADLADPLALVGRARQVTRTIGEQLLSFRGWLEARSKAITGAVAIVSAEAEFRVSADIVRTVEDVETIKTNYVSIDAGLLVGLPVNELLPYAGANIYLRPVNPTASLKTKGSFSRRFSLTVGLTLASIAKENEREDLFGSQALVLGAGLRLTPVIRFSSGALLFKSLDPNPLITKSHTGAAWYFALSADYNIASAILEKIK